MRKSKIILIGIIGIFTLFSCETERENPVIDVTNVTRPSIISPADGSSFELLEDSVAANMTTFTWTEAEYEASNLPDMIYQLQMDFADSNFVNALVLQNSTDISYQVTVGDMNNRLLGLDIDTALAANMAFRVMASQSEFIDDVYSNVINLSIKAYKEFEDTITPPGYPLLYVPGDYQGWDPASAPNLASLNDDGKYEGYVNFPDANTKFKFTSHPDWVHTNFGDGGEEILDTDDEAGDLTVADAGYYKFNVDTVELSWEYAVTAWGIIGTATPDNWDSDQDMTYDVDNGVWSITLDLTAEEFKFRANDAWEINYGDDEPDGTCDWFGENIPVAEAGNYTVTLDLSNPPIYTYSVVKN